VYRIETFGLTILNEIRVVFRLNPCLYCMTVPTYLTSIVSFQQSTILQYKIDLFSEVLSVS